MKLQAVNALCASVALAALFPVVSPAQSEDAAVLPNVIRIYREEVKQGKDAAHDKVEASFAKMLAKYKYPAYSLGLTMMAGPSEAWFIEAHSSFASVEETLKVMDGNAAMRSEFDNLEALDGELRANMRSMLAVLQPGLCYNAGRFMSDLQKSRYLSAEIMRIRPYRDAEFAEGGRQVTAAYQKAGIDQSIAIYRMAAGAPRGTYLILSPMKSLQTMDEAPDRMRALADGMGGRERMQAVMRGASEVIASAETYVLAINPKTSYVSKEFAAGDPDFWTPRTAKPVKSAAKPAVKSGAGQ